MASNHPGILPADWPAVIFSAACRPDFVRDRSLARTLGALLLVVFFTVPGWTQGFPQAAPASVGISSERLDRLSKAMQQYVDRRRAAGIVTIVVRDGKLVQLAAYGKRDIEADSPMQTDAIFRIASMSKAITSTAVMILMEEGKLLLSDPVSKFIPSFKNSTVAVAPPRRCPGRRADRHPPGEARDHDQGSAHAHGRHLVRRRPRRRAVEGRRTQLVLLCRQGRADRHAGRAHGEAPDGGAAGREVHLRLQHRHPRRRRREGVGHAARSVLPDADLRAAEDERHVLLPAHREARAAGGGLLARGRRRDGGTGAGPRPRPGRLRGRPAQVLRRRGGAAVDGHRLRAVPADAGERR